VRYIARHIKSAGLALGTLAITGSTALTQDAVRAGLPDTTPCPESIAAIATCYTARHETGAHLFTVMPKNWNGNLVVFAHGGPTYTPPTATSSQRYVDRAGGPVAVKRGFAWIASSYRREGYGVVMAAEDPTMRASSSLPASPRRSASSCTATHMAGSSERSSSRAIRRRQMAARISTARC
jgi:hypothetical protein